jgi:hypothetical protein
MKRVIIDNRVGDLSRLEIVEHAVKVIIDGKIYDGRVKGLLLPFAQVVVDGQVREIEYSWTTVSRAITEGRTLTV